MSNPKNPYNIQVGTRLFFARADRRWNRDGHIIVTKVGREWASTVWEDGGNEAHRINLITLRAHGEGYASPGEAYLSEQAYKDHVYIQRCWVEIRNSWTAMQSKDITVEDMEQAMRLLRITPPKKEETK